MTKLNLASGTNRLDGFVNLDKRDGWLFQDGLPYDTATVDAITESHGIMFLDYDLWQPLFDECARVLVSGGVLRIVEDWTDNPASAKYGGRRQVRNALPCPSPVTPDRVLACMAAAGLVDCHQVGLRTTAYRDKSLIQRWHWRGQAPHVFHAEGVKP